MASSIPTRETPAIGGLRWALVVIFLFFGIAKFALYEAEGVAKIAGQYPLFAWMYPLWGPRVASGVIGTIELTTAAFLILGAWSARASLIGGAMGVCTFLITLSFLIGVPIWEAGYGAPFIGGTAQFLLKDIVLLAACYAVASAGLITLRGDGRQA
jgi:reactive chlorine resistance protein C